MALADSATQLIKSTDSQLTAAVNQVTFLSATTPEDLVSRFRTEAPGFHDALVTASGQFNRAASQTSDASIRQYAGEFAQETQALAKDLSDMQAAIDAGDGSAIQSDLDAIQSQARQYSTSADNYNTYVEQHASGSAPLSGLFLGFLVLSVVLALGTLLFWMRAEVPVGDAGALWRKERRKGLFVAALFPLVGSAVTYGWYRYTVSHGGTYVILYGPVLAGFAALVVRATRYRKAVSAAGGGPGGPGIAPAASMTNYSWPAVPPGDAPLGAATGWEGPGAAEGQPLLEGNVRYFPKKMGRGARATATLYRDSLEVSRRKGGSLASIPIAAITRTKRTGLGGLRITVGEPTHVLQFSSGAFPLFGLMGVLLSGAAVSAKDWDRLITDLRARVPSGFEEG